jgi:hypothetical protein
MFRYSSSIFSMKRWFYETRIMCEITTIFIQDGGAKSYEVENLNYVFDLSLVIRQL